MRTNLIVSIVFLGASCLGASLTGCGASSEGSVRAPDPAHVVAPSPPLPVAPPPVPFEAHEWGLVRGGASDAIVLGASLPQIMPMAVAKPVLYFHLRGEAPLEVAVTARMAEGGSIVESWPLAAPAGARSAAWSANVTRGSCHHGRLPSLGEAPCAGLVDGCEANTLGTVESEDADCVTVGAQRANHLFYRGSLEGVDPLPLVVERLADGRIRVRNRGTEPIPGVLLRVRLAHGVAGVTDAASRATPPAPGATVELAEPTGSTVDAGTQVTTTLREQGLTEGETSAFRRAWDAALFGLGASAGDMPMQVWPGNAHPLHAAPSRGTTTTTVPVAAAAPAMPPRASDSLVYFLPPSVIEQLSTLEVTPRPARLVRVIAVWLELPTP